MATFEKIFGQSARFCGQMATFRAKNAFLKRAKNVNWPKKVANWPDFFMDLATKNASTTRVLGVFGQLATFFPINLKKCV